MKAPQLRLRAWSGEERKPAASRNVRIHGAKLLKEQVSNGPTRRKPYPFRIFTSQELHTSTKSFCERIMPRHVGVYYKGNIGGRLVMISLYSVDDKDQKINEIVVLSSIRHPNVVKLLGCCLETDDPLLVYEFGPNGNLWEHIKSHDVRWSDRLRFSTQIAEALAYLHHHGPTPIVHRNVNPYNVMLDENYSAKLMGFHMSVAIPLGEDKLEDVVAGTIGYIDPEYLETGMLTPKSDVYSFGMLLFTILTGKTPSDPALQNDHIYKTEGRRIYSKWMEQAAEHFERKEGEEVRLQIQAFHVLLLKCTEEKGEDRPAIKEVARELWQISSLE